MRAYDSPDVYREDLLRRIRALDAEIRERMREAAALEAETRQREAAMERIKKRWLELEKICADDSRSSKK